MNKYFQKIAEEKDGFSFGESWRYSEDSLVALLPILRDSEKVRNYLLLRESEKATISDTGNISKVKVFNGDSKPIYIRMGEIFVGKTQERVAIRSYMVMPNEKIDIEVKCVHASKGIFGGTTMTSGGTVSDNVMATMSTASFRLKSVDQRKVWRDVAMNATNLSASANSFLTSDILHTGEDNIEFDISSVSDDFVSNINNFSKTINKVLEKVPFFKNQVGIATIAVEGIIGIECFDLTKSWEVLKEDVIKKEGEHLAQSQNDSPFEFKKEKAAKTVKSLLLTDFEEKTLFKTKDYRIIGLNSEKYTGEIVEMKDEVVHILVIKK